MYNWSAMQITTKSEQETKEFAKKFAAKLSGGMILCLYGELGAGKTTFVKGLAEGLSIKDNITSPTFTLMNIYKIANKKTAIQSLVHIDTYRLKNEEELLQIGAEDYVGTPDSITVIEWPEKVANFLKEKKVTKIYLGHASDNEREIKVESQ